MQNISIMAQNRDFFGAKLMHFPMIHRLRLIYPDCQIHVHSPYSSNIIFLHPKLADTARHYMSTKDLKSQLKDKQPDLVINLRPESGTVNKALISYRLKRKYRLFTFKNFPLSLFAEVSIPWNHKIYRARNFLNLVGGGPLEAAFEDIYQFQWKANPEDKKVYMLVGAGSGDWKKWSLEKFLSLADKFKDDYKVGFILGLPEQELAAPLQEYIDNNVEETLPLLLNESLEKIMSELSDCHLVIGNDTGPSHLAQLGGIPYVGLYSDEIGTAEAVIREWNRNDSLSKPLSGKPSKTIDSISVDEVYSAAANFLCLRS